MRTIPISPIYVLILTGIAVNLLNEKTKDDLRLITMHDYTYSLDKVKTTSIHSYIVSILYIFFKEILLIAVIRFC